MISAIGDKAQVRRTARQLECDALWQTARGGTASRRYFPVP